MLLCPKDCQPCIDDICRGSGCLRLRGAPMLLHCPGGCGQLVECEGGDNSQCECDPFDPDDDALDEWEMSEIDRLDATAETDPEDRGPP